MYFGGVNGFVRFDPKDFKEIREPPPLRLTDIKIANQSVDYDPLYLPPPELLLDHNDHSLDVSFSTMDVLNPNRSSYQYMLAGFDADWIDIGRRNTATFTSLPSGDYTLKVIGADSDGVWNYDGISLPVRVLPAPWVTWWAFAIYAAAFLALLAFIKRYYDTRVFSVEVAREARRLNLTATRAMDELREQLDTEQRLVGSVRRHAADAMDTIDKLLAIEFEELQDEGALETISRSRQRIQCLRALESGVFFHFDMIKVNFQDVAEGIFNTICGTETQHAFELMLANECTDELIPIDLGLPLTIITHELMLNSITHAFEDVGGIQVITVRLSRQAGGWQLEIADSGCGLPESIDPHTPTTMGMELVQMMAKRLGAALTVTRERGTRYQFRIPGDSG
jgi:two-component sensor histidine kinase